MSAQLDPDPQDDVEDPIEYFLQDLDYHGRSDRTLAVYRRVLEGFESFLDAEFDGEDVTSANHRACLAWIHHLRGDSADSTIATYASCLNRFYAYMNELGALGENPMTLVMDEMDEAIDSDPERRDVSIPEMAEFVRGITHPLDRAVVVTLLKTGMRVGELCNLDLRDLALEDDELSETFVLGTRVHLDGYDRTLYVDAGIKRGEAVNGERRTASNKRERSTHVPIDGECVHTLKRWLAIRPDTVSEADPVFVSTRAAWGQRLTPRMVRSRLRSYARDRQWYRTNGGADENVTPHYFRHFFTTHLRDRTGDRGIVKYLRGDVAEDIIDTYTHDWGDRVREVYEANIYSLL